MKDYIKEGIQKVINTENINISIPPKEEMGDFSVQCASLRNNEYSNPIEIANLIKDKFEDTDEVFKEIKIMGPYVNFYLDNSKYAKKVIKDIETNSQYGSLNQGKGEALLIEHTSINPNAEPHIGRCRNSLIGDFMSNLYKFTGYDVERHYYVNDLGKKIALLLIGIEKYGLKDRDFSSILDIYVKIGNEAENNPEIEKQAFDYLEMVENGDKEMGKRFKDVTDMCVEGQMKIFDTLNIHFDVFTHESDYVYNNSLSKIFDALDKKGKLHEDELGRLYVDLSDYDIPTKEPVLVLTRSNKTSLYPMKDIAYQMHKIDLNDKHNYIVLGEDQTVYMQQITAVLDILGYKAPELINYSYVLLDGDKMSTSDGNVVMVSDFMKAVKDTLIEEFSKRDAKVSDEKLQILCNACIKYTMLNVSKNKIVNFNLNNATSFTGESGIYILYSIARINSILNGQEVDTSLDIKFEHDIENRIVKELANFPNVVNELLLSHEASHLTKYIFGLTQEFSKFYEQVHINNEEDNTLKTSRLRLLLAIKKVLTLGLSILGIDTVDKL